MAASESPNAPSYRGLLALVILLGALIMLGVGALIAAAFMTSGRPAATGGTYSATLAAPSERIDSAVIDGNRILLRLSGPTGEELVVMDAGSGRIIGCFHSHPAGPPEPSATDRAQALEDDFLWLIVGGSEDSGFTLQAYVFSEESGFVRIALREES